MPGRPWWRWAAIALGAVAVAGAGWLLYAMFWASPPSPWVVRNQIQRYLKRQCGHADFAIEFNFPSAREMARADPAPGARPAPKGALADRDFNSLKEEYLDRARELQVLRRSVAAQERDLEQRLARLRPRENQRAPRSRAVSTNRAGAVSGEAGMSVAASNLLRGVQARREEIAAKEKLLAPIASDLWKFQEFWQAELESGNWVDTNRLAQAQAAMNSALRAELAEAATYRRIYELIGQQLGVARRLFKSANLRHRHVALDIARQARSDALEHAQDAWLAARICEGYLWPHLGDLHAQDRRSRMNPQRLLDECAEVFWQADETNNVVLNYAILRNAAPSPWQADWARMQLARVHMRIGDFPAALREVKGIRLTNDFSVALRWLPFLEQRTRKP